MNDFRVTLNARPEEGNWKRGILVVFKKVEHLQRHSINKKTCVNKSIEPIHSMITSDYDDYWGNEMFQRCYSSQREDEIVQKLLLFICLIY